MFGRWLSNMAGEFHRECRPFLYGSVLPRIPGSIEQIFPQISGLDISNVSGGTLYEVIKMEACDTRKAQIIVTRDVQIERLNATAASFQIHRFSSGARSSIVISLLALFACTWPVTAQAVERLELIANKAKRCVLHIWAYGPDGKPRFTGTGFFVSKDGMLVSNHHMLGKKVREEKNSPLRGRDLEQKAL